MSVAATYAVEADGLRKAYPTGRGKPPVQALDGLGFTVEPGTVFGLLGPNGAGKSTTVKILATLSRADEGTARVAGADVATDPDAVRRRIGLVSQQPSSDPMATGRENLVLAARIQGLNRTDAHDRAGWLLEPVRDRRRRRPAGAHLVGRHGPQARRGDRARAPTAGAVPRRADHRPRPGGARRAVARDRPDGRRGRDDGAADHALPRRGRPPRRTGWRSSTTAGSRSRGRRSSSRASCTATSSRSSSRTTSPRRGRPGCVAALPGLSAVLRDGQRRAGADRVGRARRAGRLRRPRRPRPRRRLRHGGAAVARRRLPAVRRALVRCRGGSAA